MVTPNVPEWNSSDDEKIFNELVEDAKKLHDDTWIANARGLTENTIGAKFRVGVRNGHPKSCKMWKNLQNNGLRLFRDLKFVARFSKCDFWIPEQMSGWSSKQHFETNIVRDEKTFREKKKTFFFLNIF